MRVSEPATEENTIRGKGPQPKAINAPDVGMHKETRTRTGEVRERCCGGDNREREIYGGRRGKEFLTVLGPFILPSDLILFLRREVILDVKRLTDLLG